MSPHAPSLSFTRVQHLVENKEEKKKSPKIPLALLMIHIISRLSKAPGKRLINKKKSKSTTGIILLPHPSFFTNLFLDFLAKTSPEMAEL